MKTQESVSLSKGYRFPAEIISHCVWLSFRFSLRFRDVEEIMAERGVVLTYMTIRQWCLKFGQQYANEVKHSRPRTGDTWHAGRASFSPSMGKRTPSGEPSISMELFSLFWFRGGEISRQPRNSSVSCLKGCNRFHASSLLTSCPVTEQRNENCSLA